MSWFKSSQKDRTKPRIFTVAISKSYFPEELQKTLPAYTEVMFVEKIKAISREDAAKQVWDAKGQEWLSQMNPKQTKVRHISLYVNEPTAGVGGLFGRLGPIRVFTESV